MPNVYDGKAADSKPPAGRYAIVVSRYNENITRKLLDGALETLAAAGVADDDIDVAWVPGAFELPVAASRMSEAAYEAIICLGCVIRGETTHDEHINRAVSRELANIATCSRTPVMFGVLTCQSLEQAIQRSGGSVGNKGAECAAAALEMARLMNQLIVLDSDLYEDEDDDY